MWSARCPWMTPSFVSVPDQLLAAVDVVRGSGDRRVGHEVNGERGDVGRADDTPDRQRRTKLLAACVEPVGEDRRRERCVDEAGGDRVHADGRYLQREV